MDCRFWREGELRICLHNSSFMLGWESWAWEVRKIAQTRPCADVRMWFDDAFWSASGASKIVGSNSVDIEKWEKTSCSQIRDTTSV